VAYSRVKESSFQACKIGLADIDHNGLRFGYAKCSGLAPELVS
jgi:hypothetical protein